MHDRLAQLLDREVVGEVTRIGDTFFDVGLGRINLTPLRPDAVEQIVARLREAFGARVGVDDRLHLEAPAQPVRGQVDITLRDEQGNPYRLQVGSEPLWALRERRFALDEDTVADLTGTFVQGLLPLVAGGQETGLRILSGHDELLKRYLEQQDRALHAALAGRADDTAAWLEQIVDSLRRCWRLIPWPLRSKLDPVASPRRERVTRHDRVLRRTVLFARDVHSGDIVYEYVHQHNELEEYDQVLEWMTEIHAAVFESYPAPRHVAAMARASTIHTFLRHFPGFQPLVGLPDEQEGSP